MSRNLEELNHNAEIIKLNILKTKEMYTYNLSLPRNGLETSNRYTDTNMSQAPCQHLVNHKNHNPNILRDRTKPPTPFVNGNF